MRYEDASNSFQGSGPNANDDSDQLPAGSKEAATGNLISGEGTQYGAAGADSAAGGHITSIAGKGGEDSSFAGGKLSVAGEFGKLSVDAEGNYNYMANKGAPENVRDRFTYTLADNQGGSDTAALVIELGKTPVVIKADAQQVVPGPDGVVTLPPGVDLSDVMVVGRNLVINMPDGTQLIIVDGAIFVPQLVLDGVSVPATNVAALLIGQEPQPAAGELPPSSGGNFALPPPPLDPGVPLGDLIPPTVRDYIPPEPQEVFDELDREPTVVIQPVDQAPSVNAVDSVDERGLPTRNGGEPEGTGEGADGNPSNNSDGSEATSGTIVIDSPDGVDSVTIAGADGVPHEIVVGLVVDGEFGTLTITGIVGDDYTYSYVLNDNTSGDDTHDDFAVVLTDSDGDVASASLTIDIIDDVPTARNDVDSVTEGGPEVADGNVLTGSGGADANSTDGVADTVGADDADVTGFSQGNTNGTLGAPFAAQHGTLVLNADGSYTYTLDGEDPDVRALGDGETLTEVFTYSLTDGDGDVSTATLTITIVGTNEAPTIRSDAAVVSEEGLEGVGLPDNTGSDDTTDSATDSGTMVVSDADGDPVTVTLSTSGLPALTSNTVPIVWALSDGGHTLTGTAGGNPIITITIDDSGNWDVELTGPVDHADPNVEDDLSFNVQVTVDDGSETGSGTLTVTIEDDSPVVTAGEVEPSLLADESDFTVNDTKNFGDVFNVQFGGDGGAPDQVAYALGTPGGDSGLVDTLTNEAVVLTLEGGEVVGRTEFGGDIVFVVSVDADGNVTVDQQRAVVHADPNNHNDTISLSDDNLITLTATATDNDGDEGSATINIGNNVVLADDGPSIDRNQNAVPDLVTDDTNTPNDTDSASFAGLFTGAFGADGPKDVDDNDVPDADAIAYSLSINGGDGTDSGLVDVLTGDPILLFVNGDAIEGRVGGALGPVAFTLTLDPSTGVITQEQDRAVTHNDPSDPVESGDSAAAMNGDLIVLTATITDGDFDTDSATANIGDAFHFEDDGPSISPSQEEPSLTVDETFLLTDDSADFSGAFNSSFGKDGPKDVDDNDVPDADAIGYQLGISASGAASGLVDTLSGDPILLFMSLDGTFVEGRVGGALGPVAFTVTVDSSGNVTLDQQRAVVHDDPNDPDEAGSPAQLSADNLITLTATITDGDGDTDSATIGIGQNLNFRDDGPSIDRNTTAAPVLVTDDTNTPNDTDGPVSFAGLFTGAFGNDGFKDADDNDVEDADAIAYSLTLKNGNGTDSGLNDVVTGDDILLRVVGNTIEGYLENATGTVAFTITLNPATGAISLEQDRAITHDDPTDPIESGADAETMAADLIVLNATITDGDGDTDTATANIGDSFQFEDDGPNAVDDVDSVGAPGTSATGNVITGVDIIGGDANGTDGNADDVGADTPGSIVGVAAGDTDTILNNPGTVGVQIQGDFGKLTLNANGSYTYVRDIGSPGGGEDVFTYTLTDADGDKVTATLTIQIADAVPVAGTESATVDDDGLANANPAGTDDINANLGETPSTDPSEAIFNGTLNATGGDAPLTFSLIEPADGAAVGQETVNYSLVGNVLTATIATSPDAGRVGDTLFTVELVDPSTGDYVVTLEDNVLHGNDANDNEDGIEVQVTVPYQVEDADGSTSVANGQLTISFNDDVPSAAVSVAGLSISHDETPGVDGDADDDALAHTEFAGVANPGNDPDVVPNPIGFATSTGAVSSTGTVFGADGGTAVFSLAVSGAGVDSNLNVTGGESIELFKEGNLIVGRVDGGTFDGQAAFAIAIDPTTGVITMVQYLSIQHPNPASLDESVSILNTAISAVNTVTDADGDVSTASTPIGNLISFQDDGPTTYEPEDAELTNEAGAAVFFDLDDPGQGGDDDIGNNFGADGPGLVRFPSTVDNSDSGLTSGGVKIWYIVNGDGTVLQGKTGTSAANAEASGSLIFTITLDQANDRYSVDMDGTVDAFVNVDFTDANFDFVGGNGIWFGIVPNGQGPSDTPVDDNSQDVLITPTIASTINTSNILGGVGSGQSVGAGEGFRLDFVVDLTGDPPNGNYANGSDGTVNDFDFDTHWNTNGATVTMRQSTGSEVRFQAFDDTDSDTVVGDGVQDTINKIIITYNGVSSGNLTPLAGVQNVTLDGVQFTYKLDADGKSVIVNNVQGNTGSNETPATKVAIFTADGYTSLEVEHVSGDTFKFSGFGAVIQSQDPVLFSIPTEIVDGDGDVVPGGDIDVTLNPPVSLLSLPLSTFMSQEEQLQKTAANSNTLTLATAVAAAGFVESVAAHDNGNHNGHGQNSDLSFAAAEVVERYSVSDDSDSAAVSMLAPEASSDASAPADTSSSSSSDHESADHSVDDGAAHAAPESNDAPAADGGGSNNSAEAANPVAPTVAMVSAEALQAAAANDVGHGQKGGSVEKVVAEALHDGGSDVDAVLANLPGGNGVLQALAHMASPDVAAVSGWHMPGHGSFGGGHDMMFKMDVATHHQDAVQPVQNG